MDEKGRIFLCDFGLARNLTHDETVRKDIEQLIGLLSWFDNRQGIAGQVLGNKTLSAFYDIAHPKISLDTLGSDEFFDTDSITNTTLPSLEELIITCVDLYNKNNPDDLLSADYDDLLDDLPEIDFLSANKKDVHYMIDALSVEEKMLTSPRRLALDQLRLEIDRAQSLREINNLVKSFINLDNIVKTIREHDSTAKTSDFYNNYVKKPGDIYNIILKAESLKIKCITSFEEQQSATVSILRK